MTKPATTSLSTKHYPVRDLLSLQHMANLILAKGLKDSFPLNLTIFNTIIRKSDAGKVLRLG